MLSFKSFLAEENVKVTCMRCGGSGKFSYNLLHGDVCYGCKGRGFVIMTKKAYEKQQASQKKREADKIVSRAEQEERAKSFEDRLESLRKKYKDDKRLGSVIKKRMEQFPAVEQETLEILDQADTKGNVHPKTIEGLGDSYMNVPFAKKALAKEAGAKWDATERKWIWNINKKIPKELEQYLE